MRNVSVVVLWVVGCLGCSGSVADPVTCGSGTVQVGAQCVATSSSDGGLTCAAGTVQLGASCVASPSDGGAYECGPGTTLVGTTCVLAGLDAGTVTCGAGTQRVGSECVAVTDDGGAPVTCGSGTIELAGQCRPITRGDGGTAGVCTEVVVVGPVTVAASTRSVETLTDCGSAVSYGGGESLVVYLASLDAGGSVVRARVIHDDAGVSAPVNFSNVSSCPVDLAARPSSFALLFATDAGMRLVFSEVAGGVPTQSGSVATGASSFVGATASGYALSDGKTVSRYDDHATLLSSVSLSAPLTTVAIATDPDSDLIAFAHYARTADGGLGTELTLVDSVTGEGRGGLTDLGLLSHLSLAGGNHTFGLAGITNLGQVPGAFNAPVFVVLHWDTGVKGGPGVLPFSSYNLTGPQWASWLGGQLLVPTGSTTWQLFNEALVPYSVGGGLGTITRPGRPSGTGLCSQPARIVPRGPSSFELAYACPTSTTHELNWARVACR